MKITMNGFLITVCVGALSISGCTESTTTTTTSNAPASTTTTTEVNKTQVVTPAAPATTSVEVKSSPGK